MQSQFEQEPIQVERRYRPETVQKAAALAARLQEERRGTLSQAEVDEMAAEIGLDPRLMRQALDAVAQSEAATVTPTRAHSSRRALGIASLSSGFFLMFLIFVFWMRMSAPNPPATAIPMTPPVEASTLVSGPLLVNGSFETATWASGAAEKLARGSRSLPGWKVEGGQVLRLSNTPGGHAIQLGENGRIQQVIPTIPNQIYRVTFTLSGQPGESRRFHRVQLQFGNMSSTPSVFTEAKSGEPARWEQKVQDFQAQDNATLLSIGPGPLDELGSGVPIIDNVTVEPLGYSH